MEARREPVRRPQPPETGGRRRQAAEARGQFPLALPRPVLGRAEPGLVHVPAADPQRDPAPLAVRGRRRPRRRAWRRLRPRHHPGEPPGARDRPRAWPALPRRAHRYRPHGPGGGRRQHPQRHRFVDRRHRRPGAPGHAPPRQVLAQLDPERPLALRPAAQVQRRLRRQRRDADPGGDQRHRLPGGGGSRRRFGASGDLHAPRARRHLGPPRPRPRHRHRPEAGRLQHRRRRDHPGVHRERRPDEPQQEPDEVRPRRLGLRQVPRRRRGQARPQARPGRARARGAA